MAIGTTNEVEMKVFKCPTCGNPIHYEAGDSEVICAYCGNPVQVGGGSVSTGGYFETPASVAGGGLSIKSPSAAIAYLEHLFSTFDWRSFAVDPDLRISSLQPLIDELKVTAADNYLTWKACFLALVYPVAKKIELRDEAFNSFASIYKTDSIGAEADFEDFKTVGFGLSGAIPGIKAEAESYLKSAEKYGLPAGERNELNNLLKIISSPIKTDYGYETLTDIPAIKKIEEENAKKIEEQYREKGIDAAIAYADAQSKIEAKDYCGAVACLRNIPLYKDASELIDRYDSFVVVSSDVVVYNEKTYYIFSDTNGKGLYDENKSKIVNKLKQIICCYDGELYYKVDDLSSCAIDLKQPTHKVVFTLKKNILDWSFDRKEGVLYYTLKEPASSKLTLNRLDLKTKTSKQLFGFEGKNVFLDNSVCTFQNKERINIYSLKHNKVILFDNKKLLDFEFTGNNLGIFALSNPTDTNAKLVVYDYEKDELKVAEENVCGEFSIHDNKLFYATKGSDRREYLKSVDLDDFKKITEYGASSYVLFKSDAWLYCVNRIGYNYAMCKINSDTKELIPVCPQIKSLEASGHGYIYCLDSFNSLRKVRLDGSRNTLLCSRVTDALKINTSKVIYVGLDTDKDVKSLYYIGFGEQHRKLVYDVENAELIGDKVYYISSKKEVKKNPDGTTTTKITRYLSTIDINTFEYQTVCELNPNKKAGCYVATCVYNSYDCPQVWALRRYRDNYLDNRWFGRLFIKLYYKVSPKLVKLFGEKAWFRKPIKRLLDRKVLKLMKKGYQDTPYNDKY